MLECEYHDEPVDEDGQCEVCYLEIQGELQFDMWNDER